MSGLAVLLLAGCAGPRDFQVESMWGMSSQRFPSGATFDWLSSDYRPSRVDADSLDERIRGNIAQTLINMGYQKCSGNVPAEFLVDYEVGESIQPSSEGPQDYGSLLIRAYAPKGHVVWGGRAQAVVDASLPPEARHARIARAIREILKDFYPG